LGKEDFLEADGSRGAMLGGEAVEEASVSESFTMAVTGLLRENLRDLSRDLVRARDDPDLESGWVQEGGKWFRRVGVSMEGRSARFGSRRMAPSRWCLGVLVEKNE
jgi:hypothetical protein